MQYLCYALSADFSQFCFINNLKSNIMKNVIFTMSLVTLLILGCNTSDDELQMESFGMDKNIDLRYLEFLDHLKVSQSSMNKESAYKSDGPYFVAMYSDYLDDYVIYGAVSIPNTDMVLLLFYPTKKGEDNALINDDWIMSNWKHGKPKSFIVDYKDGYGEVVYSNWCEEDRLGKYYQSSQGEFVEFDYDEKNETNVWRLIPEIQNTNFSATGETMLTDGQNYKSGYFPSLGSCSEPKSEVELTWSIQVKNGNWDKNIKLDGVTYQN